MFVKKVRKSVLWGFVALVLAVPMALTTCDSPMGMGPPIDWEPPYLELDGDTVRYVRNDTILTGKVTDNGKVARVILRDTVSGQDLFTAKLLPNDRWEIVLQFDESRNGDKILGQIIAYDTFGNTGDMSVASITLHVDTSPPFVEDIWIKRTETREAFLKPVWELKDLENSDSEGLSPTKIDWYQNGVFWVDARIDERETRIDPDTLKAYIYDESRPGTPIFPDGLTRVAGSTVYNPRFLFDEEEILDAGERLIGSGYKTRYKNGERFYYRINIVAIDKALNESVVNEQDYFCMWQTADTPKGIVDPKAGLTEQIALPKGSSIPLVFYDDDTLENAFAALFTKEQWDGIVDIGPSSARFTAGDTEEAKAAKLKFISDRLLEGTAVTYDWNYDKHRSAATPIKDQVPENSTMDEKYYDVQIGNADSDYGEYKLITVVKDKKLKPHGDTPATYDDLIAVKVWDINVIDENAPLIVFDKTNGCPEENTFPKLNSIDGKTFEIVGYTLRENITAKDNNGDAVPPESRNSGNRVAYFRMAWIPYGLPGGADSHVAAVRSALELRNPVDTNFPAGVQWWTFKDGSIDLMGADRNVKISNGIYREQHFTKTFDVTGEMDDDLKPEYKNFYYNGRLENETKLLLFYAEDSMGHITHSQLYLLGQKSPPDIFVYDLTDARIIKGKDLVTDPEPPPDIKEFIPGYSNDGTITDAVRKAYQKKLDEYNALDSTYTTIFGGVSEIAKADLEKNYVMAGLQPYPRNTYTTYWVEAKGNKEIALKEIRMEDVTTSVTLDGRENVGYLKRAPDGTGTLSYTEFHPEVTAKTFRFTAIDVLNNEKSIQRTVMITNTAYLTEITTKTIDGEYGIGTNIELEARFSSMVQWTGSTPPALNVRYQQGGSTTVTNRAIPTSTPAGTSTLSLKFPLTVAVGDGGRLETLFNAPAGGNTRPITLATGTKIIDSERITDDAFLPGYAQGFVWADAKGSLQAGKNIRLNGTRPRSDGIIAIGGKPAYTAGEWYFKGGETVELTLSSVDGTTNNLILPGGLGKPRIQVGTGDNYAEWQRSANNGRSMVFSISADALPSGQYTSLTLNKDNGDIVNGVGNPLIYSANTNPVTTLSLNGATLWIDKDLPSAPVPTLTNAGSIDVAPVLLYNYEPTLRIPPAPANKPAARIARIEYSLNNGFEWVTFANRRDGWTVVNTADSLKVQSGDWVMRTRYIDKAGNEGTASNHAFSVNANFPELRSITALQPNGIYKEGDSLEFNLVFADNVRTQVLTDVTITLSNRNTSPTATQIQQLTATAASANPPNTNTISFTWNLAAGTNKEMLDGLYISAVNFNGLQDKYGNTGGTGTAATANPYLLTITKAGSPNHTCTNLNGAGLIVDCIAPTLSSMTPVNAEGRTGTGNYLQTSVMSPTNGNANTNAAYNRIITLTFSEPVQAGTGTITVKPHGTYNIPPVFENDSYYLLVRTGARSSTPVSGYSKITGFYDIYNALPATGTPNRTNLARGSSMTSLDLDARTGQSAGPYIKMTQGLKQGAGYSGAYTATQANAELNVANANGPNVVLTATNPYMVPDTATKWVLDYRYSIDNKQNTQIVAAAAGDPGLSGGGQNDPVVTAVRAALTAAKYRWQEIDVTAGSVTYSTDRKTVTITLPEALENGLEWDICYPAGTFTDLAGHSALALNYFPRNNDDPPGPAIVIAGENGNHWFVSNGVQIPVIRVNRKSFDARTSGNWAATGQGYAVPSNRGGPGGWGIGDFNTVHFRIETETRIATLSYAKIQGSATNGSVYLADANVVWGAVPGATTTVNWNETGTTRGTVVRANLIRRSQPDGSGQTWSVTDENGVQTTRSFQGGGQNNRHNGFRSYNKDARENELTGAALAELTDYTSVSSGTDLNFTYRPTEARKDYVVASASVTYGATVTASVRRGYEGVFRSVVALWQHQDNNPMYVEGSNVKNGMPSIAGFPVRDAEETGDNRYIKVFYRTTNDNNRQFYWVSTEIVSDWYFLKWGNGNTHQSSGEVNNYLTAGYGDLTFGYQVRGY
jgi:hypothetical protein